MPESKIYNIDCLAAMREMPDKAFELAIVDPPYGIGKDGARGDAHRKAYKFKAWDSDIPTEEYFTELFRASKNQIIWGANYFCKFLPKSMGWVFWDKGQRISQSDGELAFTSFERALRVFDCNRFHIARDGAIHPTQKPIALYKWLLQNYAKPGDTILDTHLGSGSSRIAAYDMGFDFTGYELDAEYFNASDVRFKNHISNLKLFAPDEMYRPEQARMF
jgi:site-specific DNA-methyltransferase (adenine-specific)